MVTCLIGLFVASIALAQEKQYGFASIYPPSVIGLMAASGEVINDYEMTAAHQTLPFNTVVLVTNLNNNTSVRVRINDRGPFMQGVILELSPAVTRQLKCDANARIRVRLDVVDSPDLTHHRARSVAVNVPPNYNFRASTGNDFDVSQPKPQKNTTKPPVASVKPKVPAKPVVKAPPAKPATKVNQPPITTEFTTKGASAPRIYNLSTSYIGQYGIQTGVYSTEQTAINRVNQLKKSGVTNILLEVTANNQYRVLIGPYPNKAAADTHYKQLRDKKKVDGYTVMIGKQ